jgi:hypothetical protein
LGGGGSRSEEACSVAVGHFERLDIESALISRAVVIASVLFVIRVILPMFMLLHCIWENGRKVIGKLCLGAGRLGFTYVNTLVYWVQRQP